MLTSQEENYIIEKAYIPEHLIGLMAGVSGGEPFLLEDCLCLLRDEWVIVVGYPLGHDFVTEEFETLKDKVIEIFQPRTLSLMAPELSESLIDAAHERERDQYYVLELGNVIPGSGLRRMLRKAQALLRLERSREILKEHNGLINEFISRVQPPPRVEKLLFRMEDYVRHSSHAVVLNAWDGKNCLAAFYIVDLEGKDFASYVIGCHSKKNYVPGASDLLLAEMIRLSKEQGKHYVHLGLGVNDGIRRFKRKWGGIPALQYEMCEIILRKPSLLDGVAAILKKM